MRNPNRLWPTLDQEALVTRSIRHRKEFNEPGHAHELTFSCQGGFQFLQAERTCQWLANSIEAAKETLHFDLWAFVFMPEHVHLLIHPRQPVYAVRTILSEIKLPVARQAVAYLKKHAAQWLPRIEVRKGSRTRHQFWLKGGGYDRNACERTTLVKMIDYIHMNPVRRGLVSDPAEFRWSSAAFYLGKGVSPLSIDAIPADWGG